MSVIEQPQNALAGAPVYMAALCLSGRRCLVVGGGFMAREKVSGLLAAHALVTVVAHDVDPRLIDLAGAGTIEWLARDYECSDLERCVLVIAATDDPEVNERVFADAQARAMLVNVVDQPALCSFILPAVTREGPVSVAISTAGASPMLAARMKREIAAEFGQPYAILATLLRDVRDWAKQNLPTYADRKRFFASIIDGEPDPIALLRAGDLEGVRQLIAARQRDHTDPALDC